MTFIAVRVEVSCLLKFTLAANLGAYTLQFGCGGLVLYCSRIRKFVTYRIRKKSNIQRTENRQTENRESN